MGQSSLVCHRCHPPPPIPTIEATLIWYAPHMCFCNQYFSFSKNLWKTRILRDIVKWRSFWVQRALYGFHLCSSTSSLWTALLYLPSACVLVRCACLCMCAAAHPACVHLWAPGYLVTNLWWHSYHQIWWFTKFCDKWNMHLTCH